MKPLEMHQYLMSRHRNIYQEAQLFEQNRKPVNAYLDVLAHPHLNKHSLKLDNGRLLSENGDVFNIQNNVVDFRAVKDDNSEVHKKWNELNSFLINYQQYLTPYTLLNSLSIYNYIGERTGLNRLSNATVVDVGAGTGQIYGTFFFHPETLNYFLLDPNLRLIHDQFLRLYPKLINYPLSHILCYAENLPFKDGFADLVMSLSSIDHFKDYKQFIAEAHRILKSGGQILIASHLDSVTSNNKVPVTPKELHIGPNSKSFLNKIYNRTALKFEFYARRYHSKKRGNVEDDHMHHFEDTTTLEAGLKDAGFVVDQAEVFNHNFFIKATKV